MASNKSLWIRKWNRCSEFIEFILPRASVIPFCCFQLELNSTWIRRVPTTWHTATLQLNAGLTLMTNLSQVCFFFYWFQGRILLMDEQSFQRGGDIKRRENQISSRIVCVCVWGEGGGAILILLKYFVNINSIPSLSVNTSEYSGLTVNSNAPFCFDCMLCLDFFDPGVTSLSLKRLFKQFNFCIWI